MTWQHALMAWLGGLIALGFLWLLRPRHLWPRSGGHTHSSYFSSPIQRDWK